MAVKIKVQLTDIEPSQLNGECLQLASKFAHHLRLHNGTVLELQDKNLICNVIYHAKASHNDVLNSIYTEFIAELKRYLSSPESEAHLPTLMEQAKETSTECPHSQTKEN